MGKEQLTKDEFCKINGLSEYELFCISALGILPVILPSITFSDIDLDLNENSPKKASEISGTLFKNGFINSFNLAFAGEDQGELVAMYPLYYRELLISNMDNQAFLFNLGRICQNFETMDIQKVSSPLMNAIYQYAKNLERLITQTRGIRTNSFTNLELIKRLEVQILTGKLTSEDNNIISEQSVDLLKEILANSAPN